LQNVVKRFFSKFFGNTYVEVFALFWSISLNVANNLRFPWTDRVPLDESFSSFHLPAVWFEESISPNQLPTAN